MAKTTKRAVAVLGAGIAVAALFACNVFSSLDRCASDGDCPSGTTCDPEGRFCLRSTTEAAPPVDGADAAVESDADANVDATDSAPTACDARADFTSFSLVKGFETTPILTARLASDELTIVYSGFSGTCTDEICLDLLAAGRETRAAPFAVPGKLLPGDVSCNASPEYWPTLSADSLLIFFESSRGLELSAGACQNDRSRIWSSSRTSPSLPFGPPRIDSVFSLNAGTVESSPYLHPSGLSLYFVSLGRPSADGGAQDIYVATTTKNGFVSKVTEIAEVNTPVAENFPVITRDEKTLYFARNDAPREVLVTHRATPTARFEAPRKVTGLVGQGDAGQADAIPAFISDDQCRLYFTSNRDIADGGAIADYRLWVAERKLE